MEIFQNNRGVNAIFIHSAVDDAQLDPFAFRVLMHLSRRANQRGEAWPGLDSIAATTLMSERRVRDALRVLEDRKMIKTSKLPGGRNRNFYEISAADEWILCPVSSAAPGAGLEVRHDMPDSAAPGAGLNYIEGNPDEGNPVGALSPEKAKNLSAADAGGIILGEVPESHRSHAAFALRLGDYLKNRITEKRSKMTPTACHRLADKLAKFTPDACAEALANSVTNGWTGVFPEKHAGAKPATQAPQLKNADDLFGF